ncbi:Oidioi.mRNA.OKI2018_I69.XSR.g16962.t1.cds [Oikopleura dioica]|uniref:Oidioi.mRNA.OKI2018_I69.XSR.g16962.t1.cds n=1 Tax=Oikopleura dioica TaxID=34765 RepID=A0ABN7SLY6_OIKDI|nr:Oidioi.mRNA.OKI2018_I69.XSR.g16962.t1.cds [Oikopleura dioica]
MPENRSVILFGNMSQESRLRLHALIASELGGSRRSRGFVERHEFSPEESSVMIVMKILAMRYLDPSMAEKFETFVASPKEDQIVHKMLDGKFETTISLLTTGLAKIFEGLTEEEVRWAFLLCGRNQQGLGTSAIIRWIQAHDDDAFVDELYDVCEESCGIEFMDNEGVGLYSKQAMLNHDCEPNAEIKFLHDNHKLSVVATRDIEKGEEVCISYLDGHTLNRSKKTRQEQLSVNYLFHCGCEMCKGQNSDDETSEEEEGSEEETVYEEESFS